MNWTYSSNAEVPERQPLYDLHLLSAMKVANEEEPLIFINNIISRELSDNYQDRPENISSFIEATKSDNNFHLAMSPVESTLKQASLYAFKKKPFVLVTGDTYLYEMAKKQGINVIKISELNLKMREHSIN